MSSLNVFAPAKINLFLAITGRRADGFHDLISVVAPLSWGDELLIEENETAAYSLSCDTPGVPLDASNLVLRAAELFADAVGPARGAHFHLKKRIPVGAGLGGGSSDGTAALLGLNRLAGHPLSFDQLIGLAAKLGSDCALFLRGHACVMRGRGENLALLPPSGLARISGRRILIFKPDFSINTTWAYRQMAASAPMSYLTQELAEDRLSTWLDSERPAEDLIFNNMESPAFAKFLALPTMLTQLRECFGLKVGMSGSGSACFAFLAPTDEVAKIADFVRASWGTQSFLIEAETA